MDIYLYNVYIHIQCDTQTHLQDVLQIHLHIHI